MNDILILSTGGTFNKIYNPINGNLEVDSTNKALKYIEQQWLTKLNYDSIINKDSLEFTNNDRKELLNYIKNSNYYKIIIIHGTDTMHLSAEFIANAKLNKTIVFTGAMVPFSINKVEATANLALSLGFIQNIKNGVYIAINGVANSYKKVIKNRDIGKFELI